MGRSPFLYANQWLSKSFLYLWELMQLTKDVVFTPKAF
jgi:hypothetical protein